MNITEIKSEIAGDSYYKVEHPSGLTIFVYPKEGYTSSYAIFGTRYGSDNRYKVWIYQHKFQILRKMRCDKGSRRNCALS